MASQTKSTALSVDLNSFIYGISKRNLQNALELTKIGISLLKTFPAARDAVLEYFAMVFQDAVSVAVNQTDYGTEGTANPSLESVTMIGPELCSLGESWAPFISPWCINLIMDIAKKMSNVPNTTLQNTDPVRVLLDITTQNLTLLDSEERAKCIDMMLGSWGCSWAVGWVGRAEPALVAPRALAHGADTAREVLAHLANHPPALVHIRSALVDLFHEAIREDSKLEKKRDVIPYLLNLASKSDIVLKALTQDIEQTLTESLLERVCLLCATHRHSATWEGVGPASLVTLLMRADVRCLLLLLTHARRNLFCTQLLVTESLLESVCLLCATHRHSATWEGVGPASLVTLLMRADVRCLLLLLTHARRNLFCTQLLVTESLLERVCLLCATHRHSATWEGVGPASLVTLLMRADVRCLLLLLTHARRNLFCTQLLEYLLQKLEFESLYPEKSIPLLTSAAEEIDIVREKLLTGNKLEQYSLARIVILVCYNLPIELARTTSYLLQHSRADSTLALLVRIVSGTITMHVPGDSMDINMDTERYQNFIKTGVEYALRDAMISDTEIKRCFIEGNVPKDQKTYLHHFCLNIIKLLRWENSSRVPHLRTRPFGRAVEANLYRLGGALAEYTSLLRTKPECTMASLDEMPTCHALAEVLDRVDMSGTKAPPPSVEVILKVVQATVNYFFRCLHEKAMLDKLRGVQAACRLIRKLCAHSKVASRLALRSLLEGAMFRHQHAFGSRSADGDRYPRDQLLIHLNQKHGPITQLTQSHTSVFHAGIIGGGVRSRGPDCAHTPPILTCNNELLMGALMSCMDGNSGIVEGATSLSLLLVELVSPDVMYNGLPWPDEDFTKQVSIERELYMRSVLERCAVSRAALRRAAAARPALCLASALLRAAAATLLHRRSAQLDRHTTSPELVREREALAELLETMTLGQLLPHPLGHMLELAPELTASEIVQMLRDCLWNYTRDHVPSPALFTCDSTGLHWRDPSTCKPPATYTDTLRLIIQKRISRLGHMYPIMFLNLEKENQ